MSEAGDLQRKFSLAGKVSVVMGASGALGSAIAKGLSTLGSKLVLVGRDESKLEVVQKMIAQLGGLASLKIADLTRPGEVEPLVSFTQEEFGRIDVLVNAHGINLRVPSEEISLSDWQEVLDVNLKGTMISCQSFGKAMIKQKRGAIINLSSTAGGIGYKWGYAAYSPSKAGVEGLTRTLAVEWGRYGVRVNAVAPYFIMTKFTKEFLEQPQVHEEIMRSIPLGRLGSPDDVAAVTAFLASSASDWITGQIIHLDGGRTAQ